MGRRTWLEFGSLSDIQTNVFLAVVWCRAAQAMEKLVDAAANQTYAERARSAAAKPGYIEQRVVLFWR